MLKSKIINVGIRGGRNGGQDYISKFYKKIAPFKKARLSSPVTKINLNSINPRDWEQGIQKICVPLNDIFFNLYETMRLKHLC
jgi:hypothetical protein